jgi:UrcA family protein
MTIAVNANTRRAGLLAVFAVGATALFCASAQAEDPDQVDTVTISSPIKTVVVGRDDSTGAPIVESSRTAQVTYDPVTLTLNSGVALLKAQVRTAAERLCASLDSVDQDDDDETCVRNAVDSATPQLNAALARANATKSG